MKTLWRKNQENSSDRISHAWAPLRWSAAWIYEMPSCLFYLVSCFMCSGLRSPAIILFQKTCFLGRDDLVSILLLDRLTSFRRPATWVEMTFCLVFSNDRLTCFRWPAIWAEMTLCLVFSNDCLTCFRWPAPWVEMTLWLVFSNDRLTSFRWPAIWAEKTLCLVFQINV